MRPTTGCAGSAPRRLVETDENHRLIDENRNRSVYDMYPDWGPAKNRPAYDAPYQPESPRSREAVQTSLDLRDNGGQRPDDN